MRTILVAVAGSRLDAVKKNRAESYLLTDLLLKFSELRDDR
jgi:hypothetical protein